MSSKMENPLVSVIVITYNSSEFVLETLESAKAQTYENIELIISDDGSRDSTIDLCSSWLEENKDHFEGTKLITVEQNTGIPANCNRGVKAAQGEWIKLIAGDDSLTPDSIKLFVEYTAQNQGVQVIAGKMQRFNQDHLLEVTPSLKELTFFKYDAKKQYQYLLRRSFNFSPAAFVKKQLIEKIGYFDEQYKFFEDLPMWLKITGGGVKIHFMDEIVVCYRVGENSMINNKITMFNVSFIESYFAFRKKYVYKSISFFNLIFWQSELIEVINYHVIIHVFNNKRTKNALRFRSLIFLFSSKRYWYFLKNKLRND